MPEKINILYVDDEMPEYQRPVKKVANAFGFNLTLANSLNEAIEHTQNRRFNLIICDPSLKQVKLPSGKLVYPVDFLAYCERSYNSHSLIFGGLLIGNTKHLGGFDFISKLKLVNLVDRFKRLKKSPWKSGETKINAKALMKPMLHINARGKKRIIRIFSKEHANPKELRMYAQGRTIESTETTIARLKSVINKYKHAHLSKGTIFGIHDGFERDAIKKLNKKAHRK
jgi:hypothetical protein